MFVMTYLTAPKDDSAETYTILYGLVCSTATAATFLGPAPLSHWGQIREETLNPKL